MKKKFLSLIAASLMLGTVPQICAGPELFLGAFAATVGAYTSHYRAKQATRIKDEQQLLTTMFKNKALPSDLELIPCSTNDAETDHSSCLAINTIKINDTWTWQIFYLPKGLEIIWNAKSDAHKILEEPAVTSPHSERGDDYCKRFMQARNALIEQAQSIAIQLMQVNN
jgi:hypothetical protein